MAPFDPYHQWLGIPPEEQPAHHYRLLGITDFESDRGVISTAAERQTVFLRTLQAGEHELLVAQLLNEISQARVTLLNENEKVAYDEELRKQHTPEPVPDSEPTPAIPTPTPPPSPVVVRGTVTQEFPVSVVQPTKKPRRRRQQEIWKRPAIIGVSVVGVIGVLVLVISMMSSGDAEPVADNTADPISAEMAVETAAADKAAADKAAADKAAADKAVADKAAADKVAADKVAADKVAADKVADRAATDKAFNVLSALAKHDWKTVLALDPENTEGLRLKAVATKKAAAERAEILARDPITNDIGMKLKLIPVGTFLMGSPEGETDRGSDEQQHKVTITKPFYMQTTEVTQGQWTAVMDTAPWTFKNFVKEGPNYAASYVSWDDAVAYCKKLSKQEGKTYRLPTEAEWEYACRAGTETRWSFGDDEKDLGNYAWYDKNAWDIDEMYAHQVELKEPNAFGLYDMHGNVWEWCHDYFGLYYYKQSPEQDPQGPESGSLRVVRGGSRGDGTRDTRSALRNWKFAVNGFGGNGFRVVCELDDSTQSTPPPVPPTTTATESITNTIGMKFNKIPAGTFTMGSPEGEPYRLDDETQHMVTITKPFYMQTTEVTQEQWTAVMGTEPWKGRSNVKEGPNYATTCVSWDEAVAFCEKVSEAEGKTYRLPTEAEWEYACRAGTETAWSFGDDEKVLGDYAWDRENAWDIGEKYAHQVELKKPNAFGLYDMHGNVFEWCHDYYEEDYYKQSPAQDPTGPVTGSFRVFRGGSWGVDARSSRSARRDWFVADDRSSDLGFRLVRELD